MNSPVIFNSQIRNVKFGMNVKLIMPSNLYECKIGNDCFIGPFVEIQKNGKIGDSCKIQSHSFICKLVSIGNYCFISHGVTFINDLFTEGGQAQGDQDKWKSTEIGNNVSIGTNSTILPVSICNDAVIGTGSVVSKDITEPGIYIGNPARKIRTL